jgi:putative tricarboxylic transport membrane protein
MIALPSKQFDWSTFKQLQVGPALCLFLALVAYGFAIDYLGFIGSTIAFLILGFLVLGEKRPIIVMLVAIGVTGCFWLIMDLLGIYLNPGEWFL